MRNATFIALLGIIMLAACGPADQSNGTGDQADSIITNAKEACKVLLRPEIYKASPALEATLTGSNGVYTHAFMKPFADTYKGDMTRLSDNKSVHCDFIANYGEKIVVTADFNAGTCSVLTVTATPAADGSIKPDTLRPDAGPGHDTLKPDSQKPDSGLTGELHCFCKNSAGAALNGCQFSAGGANTCSASSTANDCYITGLKPGVYTVTGSKTGYKSATSDPATVVANQITDVDVKLSPITSDGGVTPDSTQPKPDSGTPPVSTGSVEITVQANGSQLPLAGCEVKEWNLPGVHPTMTTPANGVVEFSGLPLNYALRFTSTCSGKKIAEWSETLVNTVKVKFTFVMSDVETAGTLTWISGGLAVSLGLPLTNILSLLPAKLVKSDGTSVTLNSPDGKLKCSVTVGANNLNFTADCHSKLEGLVSGCAVVKMEHPDATNSLLRAVRIKDAAGLPSSCPTP